MKILLPIFLFLAAANIGSAATLLGIDFDHSGTSSPTQAGFQSFSGGTTSNYAVSGIASGSVTVTMRAGSSSRHRSGPLTNSGSFTYASFYQDLYVGFQDPAAPDPSRTVLTLSGLDPNTQYFIKLYSFTYDFDGGLIYSWYNTTSGTAQLLGATPPNRSLSPPTSNDEFAVLGSFTTNASGTATFGMTALTAMGVGGGSGAINGFVLSTVPEPGRALLLLFAIGAVNLRRRRSLQ